MKAREEDEQYNVSCHILLGFGMRNGKFFGRCYIFRASHLCRSFWNVFEHLPVLHLIAPEAHNSLPHMATCLN